MRGSDPAELLFGALDTAVAVMGLRGLQGYVYRRAYLTRRTWAWFGPAFLLWSTGVLALSGYTLYRETGATGVNHAESTFFDVVGLLRAEPVLKAYFLDKAGKTFAAPDPGRLDPEMVPRETRRTGRPRTALA